MKTKFILNGGFTPGKIDEDNSNFYQEILKDAPHDAVVLLVPFAKDQDRIALAAQKVSAEFIKNKGEKNVIWDVATEETFVQKLKSADVVYFHGGASLKLLETLKKFPGLEKLLNEKIIAGESAGANVWSTFFYSPKSNVVSEGLGILPIKLIPHYKKEYEGKLDAVGKEGIELVLLPEYEFRVFYK